MGSIARIDPNPPSKYQQHLSSGCFTLSEPNWIKIPGNQTKFRPSDKSAARQARRETNPPRDKFSQPRIHVFILIVFKFGARSSKSDRETCMDVEDEDGNRQLSYYIWARLSCTGQLSLGTGHWNHSKVWSQALVCQSIAINKMLFYKIVNHIPPVSAFYQP